MKQWAVFSIFNKCEQLSHWLLWGQLLLMRAGLLMYKRHRGLHNESGDYSQVLLVPVTCLSQPIASEECRVVLLRRQPWLVDSSCGMLSSRVTMYKDFHQMFALIALSCRVSCTCALLHYGSSASITKKGNESFLASTWSCRYPLSHPNLFCRVQILLWCSEPWWRRWRWQANGWTLWSSKTTWRCKRSPRLQLLTH